MLIEKLTTASSVKEILKLIAGKSINTQYSLLTEAINSLNDDIEKDIQLGNTDVALWKLSLTVALEDIKHIVERGLIIDELYGVS